MHVGYALMISSHFLRKVKVKVKVIRPEAWIKETLPALPDNYTIPSLTPKAVAFPFFLPFVLLSFLYPHLDDLCSAFA